MFPSPLPLQFRDPTDQPPHLIAIKPGNCCKAMDVPDEVFRRPEKQIERRLILAAAKQVTVWRDDHFDEPGCRPVFTQQATEHRQEMLADLDRLELADTTTADFFGVTDWRFFVSGHRRNDTRRFQVHRRYLLDKTANAMPVNTSVPQNPSTTKQPRVVRL
jgi:hypothetical protein